MVEHLATAPSADVAVDGLVLSGPGWPERLKALLEALSIAERDGLDLGSSWAYSDSASDLPMLRAVGHAVVVNPDPELTRVAKEEGWDVMRFETLGRRLKIGAALAAAAATSAAAGRVRR